MNFEDSLMNILTSCDKDQLNKYLNDDDSLVALLKSLDQYKQLETVKENLISVNKQMAEANLEKEPRLEEIKARLNEAISDFEDKKKEYLEVKESYDAQRSVNGDISLDGILVQLELSATKAEEETDIQADDFFTKFNSTYSEEELNNFQRQFLEKRTQAHIKKIKADKMKELLPSYLG